MGIPSGGSFGGSSGGGSSEFSSGGRFDDNSDKFHRHPSFNPHGIPLYNNIQGRSYRGSSGGGGGGGGGGGDCTNPCTQIASCVASFGLSTGLLWMTLGLIQLHRPLMSLNYSRLMTANSIFVKQIQIQNVGYPGPVVYSFSEKPALSDYVNYNETHENFVESNSHREWRFWLNQGSTIELSYDVKGFSQDYLVLAFIQGTQGLVDWTSAPNTPSKAVKWYRIHGSGVKDFVTDRDGDYFVAFGNLNSQDMEVTSEFNIHSTLYSVKGADKRIVLTSDVKAVNIPLPLFHATTVLLTTPSKPQEGADVWEVAVVYSKRWTTYFIIWGAIFAVIVLIYGVETGYIQEACCRNCIRIWRRSREELPLLAPQAVRSDATRNSSSVATSTPSGEGGEHGGRSRDDQNLCTSCLDARKDCFFHPCGHRCTCYGCGQRIQEGNSGLCPICRQPIRAVRRIFDS